MGKNNIFSLIYVSTPSEPGQNHLLEEILISSRAYNSTHGITGLLIYTGKRFIQLLEGDRKVVNTLYQHILNDRRHHSPIQIFESEGTGRTFAEWDMAYKTVDDELAPFRLKNLDEVADLRAESPELVLGLMHQLMNT